MTTPSTTETLNTCLGHTLTAFTDDHITTKIQRDGLYEKDNVLLFLKLLSSLHNPVVLDIGANIGNHSLAFATQAARVIAFEPIPDIFNVLEQNITTNQLKNIAAHQIALSNRRGHEVMHRVHSGNAGASSFDQKTAHDTTPITVELERGDDFLLARGIDHVDFIKLDVEAHEAFVLDGLRETINRDLPIITMEWSDPKTIERMRTLNILPWLQEHYVIWVLGTTLDRAYWHDRPFGWIRRKLAALCQKRQLVLYPFSTTQLFKNILLLPKTKIDKIEAHIASFFQP